MTMPKYLLLSPMVSISLALTLSTAVGCGGDSGASSTAMGTGGSANGGAGTGATGLGGIGGAGTGGTGAGGTGGVGTGGTGTGGLGGTGGAGTGGTGSGGGGQLLGFDTCMNAPPVSAATTAQWLETEVRMRSLQAHGPVRRSRIAGGRAVLKRWQVGAELWDLENGAAIAAIGDSPIPFWTNYNDGFAPPFAIRGGVVLGVQGNTIVVHNAQTGAATASFTPGLDTAGGTILIKLALDGSYVLITSIDGFEVWSTAGVRLLKRDQYFDYYVSEFINEVVALPGQLRFGGVRDRDEIEVINIATDTSTVIDVPAANFERWFVDGQYYVNSYQDVYDLNGNLIVRQSDYEDYGFADSFHVNGMGNYFWKESEWPGSDEPAKIFHIGQLAPIHVTAPQKDVLRPIRANGIVGVGDLTPTGVVVSTDSSGFGDSDGRWLIESAKGLIHFGGLQTSYQLGCGKVSMLEGTEQYLAMGTSDGTIRVLNTQTRALVGTLPITAWPSNWWNPTVKMSADHTKLAVCFQPSVTNPQQPYEGTYVYALPSLQEIAHYPSICKTPKLTDDLEWFATDEFPSVPSKISSLDGTVVSPIPPPPTLPPAQTWAPRPSDIALDGQYLAVTVGPLDPAGLGDSVAIYERVGISGNASDWMWLRTIDTALVYGTVSPGHFAILKHIPGGNCPPQTPPAQCAPYAVQVVDATNPTPIVTFASSLPRTEPFRPLSATRFALGPNVFDLSNLNALYYTYAESEKIPSHYSATKLLRSGLLLYAQCGGLCRELSP